MRSEVIHLKKPTRELIERYRRNFDDKNKAEEEAISALVKLFPDNKDYKGVLLKCIVINSLYYTLNESSGFLTRTRDSATSRAWRK